jgi:hypothetical protein
MSDPAAIVHVWQDLSLRHEGNPDEQKIRDLLHKDLKFNWDNIEMTHDSYVKAFLGFFRHLASVAYEVDTETVAGNQGAPLPLAGSALR